MGVEGLGMRDAVLVFIGTKCVGAAHNSVEIEQLCQECGAQHENVYLANCQEIPAIRHITIRGDWNVRTEEPL